MVLNALAKGVRHGQVVIHDPVIGERQFGSAQDKDPVVILNVTNERFWTRLLLSYDLGCQYSFPFTNV